MADLSHDGFMALVRKVIRDSDRIATDNGTIWFHCGPLTELGNMALPSFYRDTFAAETWHTSHNVPLNAFALRR